MEILCARFISVHVLRTTLLGFVKIERHPLAGLGLSAGPQSLVALFGPRIEMLMRLSVRPVCDQGQVRRARFALR